MKPESLCVVVYCGQCGYDSWLDLKEVFSSYVDALLYLIDPEVISLEYRGNYTIMSLEKYIDLVKEQAIEDHHREGCRW